MIKMNLQLFGGRGSGSGKISSVGLKEVQIIDPSDFKDSSTKAGKYAYELSQSSMSPIRYEEQHRFIFESSSGKAFADIWEDSKSNELEITTMGSTGGGAGTRIFKEMAQRALDKGMDLTWMADHKSAKDYYSKKGLDRYIDKKYSDKKISRYTVSNSSLKSMIGKL